MGRASSKKRQRPTPAPAAVVPARDRPGRGALVAGALLLAAGAAASITLSVQHLGDFTLPGCGVESACGRATSSVWGRIPGVAWPTSHVGAAYFLAVLVAWLAVRGRLPAWLATVVRLGAVASIGLIAVMLFGHYLCPYCLAVHVANLAFLAVFEWTRRGVTPVPRGSLAAGAGFAVPLVLATAALVGPELRQRAAQERRVEADLARSTQQIIDRDGPADPTGGGGPGDPVGPVGPVGSVGPAGPVGPEAPVTPPFTGRYRLGPEAAPIRIVIISDYQCPDCKRIESDVRRVLAERDDVSFSAKHFPFCVDCNRLAAKHNLNLHPNACWAARAAETAGLLHGEDGFWKMHHWLFDQGGAFTDAEIRAGLAELGFEPGPFLALMQSREPLGLVHADIEEAIGLGLRQTPMIFINGVELTGWQAADALPRAVARVAASDPPALTAAHDRPPTAFGKHLRDWRRMPVSTVPPDADPWTLGPENAATEIVVWGDYQEPFTSELDTRVRAALATRPDVRYAFRHYPIDQACNPSATRTIHPAACRAAQAAEAAGRLGGPNAYWAMHAWLMANQDGVDPTALAGAAASQGLDPEALRSMMDTPEVAAAIRADALAGKRLGLRGVPFAIIGGRQVPFWRLEGMPLLEAIIDEARGARAPADG